MGREANFARHVLATWSLLNNSFSSFDVGLGPLCFVSVIEAEDHILLYSCRFFFFFFFGVNKNFWFIKKIKINGEIFPRRTERE